VPRARDRRSAKPSKPSLILDRETSERLGRIRQHGTSAELAVRHFLHAQGHRYRVQNRDLPGSPDIANRCRKWAVFVHGCFWHRHAGCRRTTTPSRNRAFWLEKFAANVRRDAKVQRQLREEGWRVEVIWECECADSSRLRMLRRALATVR
jgi:DNA mismatch endonuclease (patch repair protein)